MVYVVVLLLAAGATLYALVDAWGRDDEEVRTLPRAVAARAIPVSAVRLASSTITSKSFPTVRARQVANTRGRAGG